MNIKLNILKDIRWFYDVVKVSKTPLYILIVLNIILGMYFSLNALILRKLVNGAGSKNKEVLIIYITVFIVFVISRIIISSIAEYINSMYSQKLEYVFKMNFLRKMLNSDYKAYSKYSSDIKNRILTVIVSRTVDYVSKKIPFFLSTISQVLSIIIVIFILNKNLGMIILISGFITILFGYNINLKRNKYLLLYNNSTKKSSIFTFEIFANLVLIKSDLLKKHFLRLVKIHYIKNIKFCNESLKINLNFKNMIEFVFKTLYIGIILWCVYKFMHRTINIGTFSALILLTTRLQSPFLSAIKILREITSLSYYIGRIRDFYDIKQEDFNVLEDKNSIIQKYNSSLRGISIENMSFGYKSNNLIFENSNLYLDKNKFYAIKGYSGIGKTTLFHLFLALFKINSGIIKVGDMEISPNTRDLFSYVPQIPCIFTGTLKNHITLFDKKISEERIKEALKFVCADEFVENLPDKLQTKIGEKGFGLSFGQCQRLAIAQALLKDAPILILDEACSGIDGTTEMKIFQNLKTLKNKTIIAISHQNYVSEICDEEIVIENKGFTIIKKNF